MDMLQNYQRGWGIGKLGHVYMKAIRPWFLRILEFSLVESVMDPYFRFYMKVILG
jgi:hypothetical protein